MKYIIEIEDTPFGNPERDLKLYKCTQFKSLVFDKEGLSKLTPYTEPDRKAVENAQEEAWEFARNIVLSAVRETGEFTIDEMKDCFGSDKYFADTLKDFSYQEAKARYETWKKKKGEIHVGDEVVYSSNLYNYGVKGVVLSPETDDAYAVILILDNLNMVTVANTELKKTGRHFDEVEELLKKMEENK